MRQDPLESYFRFFTEVGIIEQLSRNLLEARLPAGFILPHFAVLNHLALVKDGEPPLGLARAFQLPKTSMTHTLAALERAGLVRVEPNPEDRRSKCIWITDQGRAFRTAAIEAVEPDIRRLAAAFPAEKLEAVLPVLQSFRRMLDNDRLQRPAAPLS